MEEEKKTGGECKVRSLSNKTTNVLKEIQFPRAGEKKWLESCAEERVGKGAVGGKKKKKKRELAPRRERVQLKKVKRLNGFLPIPFRKEKLGVGIRKTWVP